MAHRRDSLGLGFLPSARGSEARLRGRRVAAHRASSDWRELFIFGEEDFAEGGGASPFVTIQSQTGMVFGLDVERDGDATFLLNSSVSHFIETFRVFDEVLRTGTASPSGLLERVRAADPDAFERSEWRDAAEHVRSSVVGV
jgi:hypothetical protein